MISEHLNSSMHSQNRWNLNPIEQLKKNIRHMTKMRMYNIKFVLSMQRRDLCKACNLKKGGQTPSEAKMYLKVRPYQPTISEFLRLKFENLGIHDIIKDLGVF